MNLALFGGSFDPPHLGHDKIVKEVLKELNIDKLIIMPTYISPFKNAFSAPPKLRLKWVNELWSNFKKVEISDFEISLSRPVPSIETVRYLKKIYKPKKIYLLIGADHLNNLEQWHEFKELNQIVEFIVIKRNNFTIPTKFKIINLDINLSSSDIRDNKYESLLDEKINYDIIKFYKGQKVQERTKKIAEILDEKKAQDIEIINMDQKDYFAKSVIIATSTSARHCLSLVDELKNKLKNCENLLASEVSDNWAVLDFGEILIHIMTDEYRKIYNIEDFLTKLETKNS